MLLVAGAMLEKRSTCHAYYDAMEDVNKQTNTRLSCVSNALAVLVQIQHVAKPCTAKSSDYTASNFYPAILTFLFLDATNTILFLTLK